ncbi:SDR family NAD(P)-dependent oxidoreductase [Rhodoplanes sp. TEM]|uniref:SDR family NAD(P)-dependent oxidoreductase n=1 Tax=Rhodoplanes tepidamans TaxID=200616 RepID=A0ABT5J4X4_RHOTP|nr:MULTISPECIES: SDR family oxidoreductase [Rhodoplanes]MDC7784369.1 SDR family NAD(P)-dependent oxidoreductase [Rhodoplanes tepidamans]MDC7983367.1 SDR family NAD(P)-dependent oxidoreductase [Rhodoplanes sp. TEM]MDQ0354502.1 NAD(P)-dependent dehydrogenase (short-subunit alcohol dehydrogenase family) [Rhodoplanes tepidamans]
MGRLVGRTALVTGAGSGIGETTAKLFAREGARVVLVGRREASLRRVEAEIEAAGGAAAHVAADLSTRDGCETAVAGAVAAFGRLDVLVNNAGIADQHKSTVNTTDDLWGRVIATNLTGVFRMCRAALPRMERQGAGTIVNVSSIGGVYGIAGASYSSAKAAVLALTRNIAIQYAGRGIRCNATCPGPTPTPMLAATEREDVDRDMREITARHVDTSLPVTETIDQANAILFLACDESKAITGQYLVIDNGMCL